jgi:hypothetical protein
VIAASGEPLPDAVVQLISANPVAVPRVAITGAKGTVAFSDVPSGSLHVAASARGFATSAIRVSAPGHEVRFTPAPAYRVTATVALPAAAGPHFVRLLDDTNASMDSVLDGQSDRRIDPPGALPSVRFLGEPTSSNSTAPADAAGNGSASSTATLPRPSDCFGPPPQSGHNTAQTRHGSGRAVGAEPKEPMERDDE